MVKNSLAARVVLWVTLGVISIFTVVNSYDYLLTKELLDEQLRQLAEFEVSASETRASDILDSLEHQTNLTAALIREVSPSQTRLELMLKMALQQNEYAYGMAVVVEHEFKNESYGSYFHREKGAKGRQLKFVDLNTASYALQAKEWYKQARQLDRPTWTEPYYDEGAGNILMTTYLVPFEIDGRFTLITVDLAVSTFQKLLASMEDKQDMSIYAITPNGHIISGNDEAMMLQQLYEIGVNDRKRPEWFRKLLIEIKEKKTGSFLTFCPRMKENCWISYAPLGDTQWTMLVAYSQTSLTTQLNSYSVHRLMQMSIGIALLIWVIWSVTRRQFLPLKELDKATQEFAQGKLDYVLPLAVRSDEIGSLTQSFSMMQVNLQAHIEDLKRETQHRERIESDLRAASQIQQSLLPNDHELHNVDLGVQLSAYLKPARTVGGDLYYYNLQEDEGRLRFVIGDVSDKGVTAAIFMARVVTAIRAIAETTVKPEALLTLLNNQLIEHNDACMFVTLLAGTLNLRNGELELSSAGHPMPFYLSPAKTCSDASVFHSDKAVVNNEKTVVKIDQLNGPALGLYPYEFECLDWVMESGASLFTYTDGLDEAVNAINEPFGEQRIQQYLDQFESTSTSELITNMLKVLDQFVGDAEPADDLTLLAIHWRGREKIYEKDVYKKKITIEGRKEELECVNLALDDYLREFQLPDSLSMTLQLIAEEVMVNVINYGYDENAQGVSLLIDHDEKLINLTFVDRARAFNPLELGEPRLGLPVEGESVGGLGIHLIKEMSDFCRYEFTSGENRFTVSCYITT